MLLQFRKHTLCRARTHAHAHAPAHTPRQHSPHWLRFDFDFSVKVNVNANAKLQRRSGGGSSSSSSSGTALFIGYTFVSCFWFSCLWLSLFTRFFVFASSCNGQAMSSLVAYQLATFLPFAFALGTSFFFSFLCVFFCVFFISDLVPCYNLLWLFCIFYFLMYNQPAANWIDDFGIKCLLVYVCTHTHTHA